MKNRTRLNGSAHNWLERSSNGLRSNKRLKRDASLSSPTTIQRVVRRLPVISKKQAAFEAEYRLHRTLVLERDDYLCRVRGEGCNNVASHVHHILPRSKGGGNEIENLLSTCGHCHLNNVHGNPIWAKENGFLK